MLTDVNLKNMYGGASWVYFALGGAISFLIGLIDGIFRPLKCNR